MWVRACDFGVPQLRPRYFTIGIREDLIRKAAPAPDFFEILKSLRKSFLAERGLPTTTPVNVEQAISDLRVDGQSLVDCVEPESPKGFRQLSKVSARTTYQRLMHGGLNGQPVNSLRLPNHRESTIAKFREILATCRKGVQLSRADRERLEHCAEVTSCIRHA